MLDDWNDAKGGDGREEPPRADLRSGLRLRSRPAVHSTWWRIWPGSFTPTWTGGGCATSTPTSCSKPASSLAASAASRYCATSRSRFAAASTSRSSVPTGRARRRCLKAFDRMMIGEISGELDICGIPWRGLEAIGPGQAGGACAAGRQPRDALHRRAVPADVPLSVHEPLRHDTAERPQGGARGDGRHRHHGLRRAAAWTP